MQEQDGTMRPLTDEEIAAAGGAEQLARDIQATVKGLRHQIAGKKQEPMRRIPPARTVVVGMKIAINGALFEVRKITKKDVVLRGVPQRGRDAGPKDGAV